MIAIEERKVTRQFSELVMERSFSLQESMHAYRKGAVAAADKEAELYEAFVQLRNIYEIASLYGRSAIVAFTRRLMVKVMHFQSCTQQSESEFLSVMYKDIGQLTEMAFECAVPSISEFAENPSRRDEAASSPLYSPQGMLLLNMME